MNPAASKVTADHLRRNAYLYVRQSSLHQLVENTESTIGFAPGDSGRWGRWPSTLAWCLQPSSGGTRLVGSRPTRADRTADLSGSMNRRA